MSLNNRGRVIRHLICNLKLPRPLILTSTGATRSRQTFPELWIVWRTHPLRFGKSVTFYFCLLIVTPKSERAYSYTLATASSAIITSSPSTSILKKAATWIHSFGTPPHHYVIGRTGAKREEYPRGWPATNDRLKGLREHETHCTLDMNSHTKMRITDRIGSQRASQAFTYRWQTWDRMKKQCHLAN